MLKQTTIISSLFSTNVLQISLQTPRPLLLQLLGLLCSSSVDEYLVSYFEKAYSLNISTRHNKHSIINNSQMVQ